MNRYVLGGVLLGLVFIALSGITGNNRTARSNTTQGQTDRSQPDRSQPNRNGTRDLGTLPIDQAGRVIRRQGDGASSLSTDPPTTEAFPQQSELAPDPASTPDSFTAPAPAAGPNSGMRPVPNNVIPQQPANTSPSVSGDIDVVNPNLVRPEMQPPTTSPDLDPIPALW